MKKSIPSLPSVFAALAVLPTAGLFAQAPAAAPAATPSVSAPASTTLNNTLGTERADVGGGGGEMRKAMMSLTPEERQKLRAAHQAAMQDPEVKAAEATTGKEGKRANRRVLVQAMIKADPSVAPILEKLRGSGINKKDLKNN